jgi:hypothetical protein
MIIYIRNSEVGFLCGLIASAGSTGNLRLGRQYFVQID